MNGQRPPQQPYRSSTDPKAGDALADRLKAYKKSTTQGKAPPPAAAKANTHSQTTILQHTEHPVSGEALALPHSLAMDFQSDVIATDLLFFDLESTGLGSSEQTYPFLIGYAAQKGDAIETTACFATTPAGEDEILSEFIRAAEGRTLVSFNGKSFDLPLILRRAEKYGLKNNLKSLRHIDLFHLIRRIYPEKPARLIDAETRLLDFTRSGDISGAEVSQAYFEFVRFDRRETLEAICNHNLIDVVSLVSLALKVSGAFTAARAGTNSWAYKIHRDKSAARDQKKTLLLKNRDRLDARDIFVLGQIHRSEKHDRSAARHFIASYRAGYPNAVIDAVRAFRRLTGKEKTAKRLVEYALAREDERVQRQLLKYL